MSRVRLDNREINIWASADYPGISKCLIAADIIEVADLPTKDGIIDYRYVQQKVQQTGLADNVFLLCMALQKIFSTRLGCLPSDRVFLTHLALGSKKLLTVQRQFLVSLMGWEVALRSPITFEEQQKAFYWMLKHCRVSKFYEINFKILHCILATPQLIAHIKGSKGLQWDHWCGEVANINHILLNYTETNKVCDWVSDKIRAEIPKRNCILGQSPSVDLIIWVVNFAIYKTHLQWCEGIATELLEGVMHECAQYSEIFPALHNVVT